jgi:hypothetical protein
LNTSIFGVISNTFFYIARLVNRTKTGERLKQKITKYVFIVLSEQQRNAHPKCVPANNATECARDRGPYEVKNACPQSEKLLLGTTIAQRHMMTSHVLVVVP